MTDQYPDYFAIQVWLPSALAHPNWWSLRFCDLIEALPEEI